MIKYPIIFIMVNASPSPKLTELLTLLRGSDQPTQ